MSTACQLMATKADAIAAEHPEWNGRELLVELGFRVAGVRRGPLAALGLLSGGRSHVRGGGFRAELRDRSAAQTRHFAGIARAVTVFGPERTAWLSKHVRRDAPGSPDGLLTDLAIVFASALLEGEVAVPNAGAWIREHVCA